MWGLSVGCGKWSTGWFFARERGGDSDVTSPCVSCLDCAVRTTQAHCCVQASCLPPQQHLDNHRFPFVCRFSIFMQLVDPWCESRWRQDFLPKRPDRFWGPPSLLFNGYRGSLLGVKWPGRLVDYSRTSSAEVN